MYTSHFNTADSILYNFISSNWSFNNEYWKNSSSNLSSEFSTVLCFKDKHSIDLWLLHTFCFSSSSSHICIWLISDSRYSVTFLFFNLLNLESVLFLASLWYNDNICLPFIFIVRITLSYHFVIKKILFQKNIVTVSYGEELGDLNITWSTTCPFLIDVSVISLFLF